jgi:hypothetical protein
VNESALKVSKIFYNEVDLDYIQDLFAEKIPNKPMSKKELMLHLFDADPNANLAVPDHRGHYSRQQLNWMTIAELKEIYKKIPFKDKKQVQKKNLLIEEIISIQFGQNVDFRKKLQNLIPRKTSDCITQQFFSPLYGDVDRMDRMLNTTFKLSTGLTWRSSHTLVIGMLFLLNSFNLYIEYLKTAKDAGKDVPQPPNFYAWLVKLVDEVTGQGSK